MEISGHVGVRGVQKTRFSGLLTYYVIPESRFRKYDMHLLIQVHLQQQKRLEYWNETIRYNVLCT